MTSQNYSRRSLLKTGAAGAAVGLIPFPLWYEQYASAGPVMTRYAIQSSQGAAMLAKYKQAVALMMAKPAGDPCSWIFQWYTHAVPTNTTKAAQVALLPAAQRPLANLMWNTCQAHGFAGSVEDYFCPWHRMYVYFFERIVRKVLNDPTFTLPYWDYTLASQRAVPGPFLSPTTSNALYRPDRNNGTGGYANVKAGQAIDYGIPAPSPIDTDFQSAMAETTYSPAGAKQGFCMDLDQGLHGDVHVLTGNTVGMGRVPWAANDPVFYTHHCNIDRIWASWNKNGGANPTATSWLNKTFTFADENCNQIVGTINDFKALPPLNYTYDKFAGQKPIYLGSILDKLKYLAVIQVIHLPIPPGPYHVQLPPVQEGLRQPLTTRLQALQATAPERLHLIIRNLQAEAQPGVLYRVYVGLRPDAKEVSREAVPVGTFSFFDAAGSMPGMEMKGDNGKFFSFDVTDALKTLAKQKRLEDKLNITIVPLGRADARAVPVIGSIELVQQ